MSRFSADLVSVAMMVTQYNYEVASHDQKDPEIDGPTEKVVGTRCVSLANPLAQNFTCPLCMDVLEDPMQTPCGHRFCNNCLTPLLRNAHPACPVDGEPLDPATVFPDICCKRELLSLACVCPFKNRGCSWQGEMRDFNKHCDECVFGDAHCPECGDCVQRGNLGEHRATRCSHRLVACSTCGMDIQQACMEAHSDQCPKVKVPCPVGCGVDVLRDVVESHVNEDCLKAERCCTFRVQGCDFKGTKAELESHCHSAAQRHLELVNASSWQYQMQSQQAQEKVSSLEAINKQLTQQLAVQNETLAAIRQDMRAQQVKLDVLEKRWSEQRSVVREVQGQIQNSAEAFPDKEVVVPQIAEMMDLLTTHERKLVAMEQEMRQSQTNGSSEFGPSSLVSSGAAESRRVERNEHQLNLHEIRLNESELRLQILQATSYDGNFIWKIDNYSQRFKDAASGKTPSIYSAPFYVGRFGYKVCARLYPYGDGMGRASHVSLFFVVMRGEYDALLPWPFRQKVTFKMIDQDHIEDTSDAFRPDGNSASFRRPTSSMNIASGCPLFISHNAFRSRSYVKNNAMFIKISVDTNGLNLNL